MEGVCKFYLIVQCSEVYCGKFKVLIVEINNDYNSSNPLYFLVGLMKTVMSY